MLLLLYLRFWTKIKFVILNISKTLSEISFSRVIFWGIELKRTVGSSYQRYTIPLNAFDTFVIVKDQGPHLLVYPNVCIKQQICGNFGSIGHRSCKKKKPQRYLWGSCVSQCFILYQQLSVEYQVSFYADTFELLPILVSSAFKGKVHVWSLLKTNFNLKTDLVTSIGELLIV